ncbi:uncharacterized protein DUF2490 [Thermoflavifilum aggregans]|uniref:Uncharacterized protein DUF2490 n=1 Tax=Thermoflavifilum aggregans TaxID=454188 RepID=A0A2M9CUF3_9BACT|nr:DUF2490 domain-containing protein [Thermoflavifilum aggregans]PJJ75475.1 uncharacterized protein DUF2490 [Thermoflavifilum aggregans]
MKRSFFYTLIAQIFISSIGYAQKQITHQQLYWIRYYGQYVLSPDWTLTLEVEDRRYFTHNRQLYWVLPRINVLYNLGAGWQAAAGFTYYLTTNPADPEKSSSVTVPELRPHQELDYRQNIRKLTIDHRYRLEERWIHHSSGSELTPGYSFNFRFRYQLQLSYPIINKPQPAGRLTAKLADEIMFNFGHQIVYNSFDQNRIYAGLNYGISPNVQLELGYLNWFQQRSSGNQYYNRDNIRFTLYHRLKF